MIPLFFTFVKYFSSSKLFISSNYSILFNIFISKDNLVIFLTSTIIIDYIIGVYIAYFLKKSNNSPDGSLNSKAGYLGIMKKVGILIMVWIGYEIDINFSLDICKNMITIGYLINEIISINENLAIIGLKKILQ